MTREAEPLQAAPVVLSNDHPRPPIAGPDSGANTGALIINADDWGRDGETTQRILECIQCRTVSAVSAMVFMEDSERAAAEARKHDVDAGLHLNLSAPFTARGCPQEVLKHHNRVASYLRTHPLVRIFLNPLLVRSFAYVVNAQLEEFRRLYGKPPARIDGHHHLHLCANVLKQDLLPAGTLVRRNFHFWPGQKSWGNRFYRARVDRRIARRHPTVDYLFLLIPLDPHRLQRIFSLAQRAVVEVETHPVNPEEYRLLTGGELRRLLGDVPIERGFLPSGQHR